MAKNLNTCNQFIFLLNSQETWPQKVLNFSHAWTSYVQGCKTISSKDLFISQISTRLCVLDSFSSDRQYFTFTCYSAGHGTNILQTLLTINKWPLLSFMDIFSRHFVFLKKKNILIPLVKPNKLGFPKCTWDSMDGYADYYS